LALRTERRGIGPPPDCLGKTFYHEYHEWDWCVLMHHKSEAADYEVSHHHAAEWQSWNLDVRDDHYGKTNHSTGKTQHEEHFHCPWPIHGQIQQTRIFHQNLCAAAEEYPVKAGNPQCDNRYIERNHERPISGVEVMERRSYSTG